jgi:hypothetical protein
MPTEYNANTRFVHVNKYQNGRSECSAMCFVVSLDTDKLTYKIIQ